MSLLPLGVGAALAASLINNIPRATFESELGILTIDVVSDESFDYTSNPTKHAVETGATITDHVKLEPISASLRAIMSPHTDKSLLSNPLGSLVATASGLSGGLINSENSVTDRVKLFELMRDEKVLLTYHGRTGILENCLITKLTRMTSQQVGDGQMWNINLQKVNLASVQLIDLPAGQRPVARKGGPGSSLLVKGVDNYKKTGTVKGFATGIFS